MPEQSCETSQQSFAGSSGTLTSSARPTKRCPSYELLPAAKFMKVGEVTSTTSRDGDRPVRSFTNLYSNVQPSDRLELKRSQTFPVYGSVSSKEMGKYDEPYPKDLDLGSQRSGSSAHFARAANTLKAVLEGEDGECR